MNLTIAASLIASAAGFALAWQLQSGNITQLELDHANERISIQRAARATIERTATAVIQAQNAAAGRVAVIKRESDANRTAADGLRDDLAITRGAAALSIDACNKHANTLAELLVEAVGVGGELAAACDGHASDVRTLMDSRPK